MKSKKLIIGNWKMHPKTEKEAVTLFNTVARAAPRGAVLAAVCVPFVFLPVLAKLKNKKILLGAQDLFFEDEGAFTGEISAKMLRNYKVQFVIVGHSERRAMGEKDSAINMKIKAALRSGITPILCVGERERDDNHEYLHVTKIQLEKDLAGIPKSALSKIIIAYEPIWALSSTKNRHDVTPEDCAEMMIYIRKVISDQFDTKTGNLARIIYGGSANPKNAAALLNEGKAGGLLPGKASLSARDFIKILEIASQK